MQNLPLFNELFFAKDFADSFGWSCEWNKEVEKWLAFISKKDSNYYKNNKNRVQSEKQRDELLGEYKAAYFIEKKCGGIIVKFEPNGKKGKKLDFCFKDKNGVTWFAEVKSPSWRNEVSKKIDDFYLCELRKQMIVIDEKNWPKSILETNCPICKKLFTFEIENISEKEGIYKRIKKLACPDCKNRIWNATEYERTKKKKARFLQPQFINGECGFFSGSDAVEDAIRKSAKQFKQGENNLLIVVPNMIAGPIYGSLAAGGQKNKVVEILKKDDSNKVINAVLILEISFPEHSKTFDYQKNIILIRGDVPVLGG